MSNETGPPPTPPASGRGEGPRLFSDDAAVRHIGEGLLGCALERPEWTHEAHLAATLWILVERPDVVPERDLPAIIRRFNESVGGANSDTEGYHETITQCFIRGVRGFLAHRTGAAADREGQRAAAGAGGPAGLAAPLLLTRASVLEGSAAGVGGA